VRAELEVREDDRRERDGDHHRGDASLPAGRHQCELSSAL